MNLLKKIRKSLNQCAEFRMKYSFWMRSSSALVQKLSLFEGSGFFRIAVNRFKKVQKLLPENFTDIDITYRVLPLFFLNFAWLSMVSSDWRYMKSLFDISLSADKNTIFLNIIEVLIGIHLNCPVLKICLARFETWYIYFNMHMISETNSRRKDTSMISSRSQYLTFLKTLYL